MTFEYKENDYGKYEVTDNEDISVIVYTEESAITLTDLLNQWSGRLKYQHRVIEKCIGDSKRYKCMIEDKDYTISVLNKEKRVLKKIIHELNDEVKYYTGE